MSWNDNSNNSAGFTPGHHGMKAQDALQSASSGEAPGSSLGGRDRVTSAPKSDGPNYKSNISSKQVPWNPNRHSSDENGSRYLVAPSGEEVYAGASDLDPGLSARMPGVKEFYDKNGSDQDKIEYATALSRKQNPASVKGDYASGMATGEGPQVKEYLQNDRAGNMAQYDAQKKKGTLAPSGEGGGK